MGTYSNHTSVREQLNRILTAPPRFSPDQPQPVKRQKQRRLDPAEQAELVAAYEAGATVFGLAEQFQIHRATVSIILERHSVARRYQPLESESAEALIALYAEGWSLVRVGQRFGVSSSTVRNMLNRAGITCRPVGTNQWGDT